MVGKAAELVIFHTNYLNEFDLSLIPTLLGIKIFLKMILGSQRINA